MFETKFFFWGGGIFVLFGDTSREQTSAFLDLHSDNIEENTIVNCH